jgi:hypothetical protein
LYLIDPTELLNYGEIASLGTGITICTLLAIDLDLNEDFNYTVYSILELPLVSITGSTHINGFT